MATFAVEKNSSYQIETSNFKYDVISRFWSSSFDDKRNYIRDFLKSNYLYPGE